VPDSPSALQSIPKMVALGFLLAARKPSVLTALRDSQLQDTNQTPGDCGSRGASLSSMALLRSPQLEAHR